MIDPVSALVSVGVNGAKMIGQSAMSDYTEEIPSMDVGLSGGADLSGLRDAEYSQSMNFGQYYGKTMLNAPMTGGLSAVATTMEYWKKKKAERDFYAQKKDALSSATYMNSIGDYRDYQRRGLAESANAQRERYIKGLMKTY